MKIGYIEFPTPDNSKILGLPIASPDFLPHIDLAYLPVRRSKRALRSADEPFEDAQERVYVIRGTIEFVKTLKFG